MVRGAMLGSCLSILFVYHRCPSKSVRYIKYNLCQEMGCEDVKYMLSSCLEEVGQVTVKCRHIY